MLIFLTTKPDQATGNIKEEKWFKNKYSVDEITSEFLETLKQPGIDETVSPINFPEMNEANFIPTNFESFI